MRWKDAQPSNFFWFVIGCFSLVLVGFCWKHGCAYLTRDKDHEHERKVQAIERCSGTEIKLLEMMDVLPK